MLKPLLLATSLLCFSLSTYAQGPTPEINSGHDIISSNEDNPAHKSAAEDENSTAKVKKSKSASFNLTGTVYTGLPYIVDDNPAGFTQTFLRANINRGSKDGSATFSLLHNFYLEGYFSTNAGSIHSYDTATSKPISYINRLDLYQYASVKINLHQNIFYVRFNQHTKDWKTVLYLDAMESFLRTNVTDSISKATANVNSWLLGGNLTLQVYNDNNLINLPMSLRLSGEAFWINPMTNSFNSDLAFQSANRSDAANALNVNKKMTSNPYPYFNLDAQIQFQISSTTKTSTDVASGEQTKASNPAKNYLFLHVAYASNFVSSSTNNYYNSYLSAQIGVSLDIINTIKNYTTPAPAAATGN